MARPLIAAALVVSLSSCGDKAPSVVGDNGQGEARWRFIRQTLPVGDVTLTGVYGNDEGELYVVGWGGVILRFKDELWTRMESPTTENLTAITGVNNGASFNMPQQSRGSMIAVGWHGTILHYNPNPDGNPQTEDGSWSQIAGPTQQLAPAFKPDPMCPDFDGDGISDDGNGDGWWGNVGGMQLVCTSGATTNCDDNCVETANGPMRPIADTNAADDANAGCVGPGDMPDLSKNQVDNDQDGVGLVCDNDDNDGDPAVGQQSTYSFAPTFFDVWMRWDGTNLSAVAVGEDGAMVSFVGPPMFMTSPSALEDRVNWIAQTTTPFRYVNDCDPSTPVGTVCAGSGRLPPSCPAQCHPRKTTCSCPVGGGQCCDADPSLTGAGCADGSCGAVANACTGGSCSTLCPGCFRRLDETLRSVESVGDTLLAVGHRGTIVFGNATDVFDVWSAPNCLAPPPPLDEDPVLTAISGSGGAFHAVGAAGAIFRVGIGGDCPIETRPRPPQGFFSAVLATGGNGGFAVGDDGLFVQINGSPDGEGNYVQVIETNVREHLLALWRTLEPANAAGERPPRYWLIGAGGTIIKAGFY